MRAVFLKLAGWRKFSQFVSHHIFRHEDGIKNLTVVDQEGVSHEVGRNHRPAGPGLDWLLPAAFVHLIDFLEQLRLHERAFLK